MSLLMIRSFEILLRSSTFENSNFEARKFKQKIRAQATHLPRDGGLREVVAVHFAHRPSDVALRKAELDAALLEQLRERLQLLEFGDLVVLLQHAVLAHRHRVAGAVTQQFGRRLSGGLSAAVVVLVQFVLQRVHVRRLRRVRQRRLFTEFSRLVGGDQVVHRVRTALVRTGAARHQVRAVLVQMEIAHRLLASLTAAGLVEA